jgi:hypothetical protein
MIAYEKDDSIDRCQMRSFLFRFSGFGGAAVILARAGGAYAFVSLRTRQAAQVSGVS